MYSTCCGIPFIKLEGTQEDWKLIKDKTSKLLQEYNFKDLFNEEKNNYTIMNILDNFIDVYEGNIDKKFWRSIFSLNSESGVEFDLLTGWIGKFFP